ncbi:MAG: trehalase family glycosidase [Planctomycetota bacterium]
MTTTLNQTVIVTWEEARSLLPDPILEHADDALAAYWAAWKFTWDSLCVPSPDSAIKHPYIRLNFNNCLFMHDTTSMITYAKYAHRLFPGIGMLDNFYSRQHRTGEICREIDAQDGRDIWPHRAGNRLRVTLGDPWASGHTDFEQARHYDWNPPVGAEEPQPEVSVDGMNDPPCMALAEVEYARISGDTSRFPTVFEHLSRLYKSFQTYRRDANGLFVTDWAIMDNSPRNDFLGYGVDLISQVSVLSQSLSEMALVVGNREAHAYYQRETENLRALIQGQFWNAASGFFHDVSREGKQIPIRTIAGFMPLQAEACDEQQARALADHLSNPRTFGRPLRIPSLAADEPTYRDTGCYFRGAVWSFTNDAVIDGLQRYGLTDLATHIAVDHWAAAVSAFSTTGSFWENYSPETRSPGKSGDPLDSGHNARRDFSGFGITPIITYLLEYAIGLRPDAPNQCLAWHIQTTAATGCRRYPLGPHLYDLRCDARSDPEQPPTITVHGPGPLHLRITYGNGRTLHLHWNGDRLSDASR